MIFQQSADKPDSVLHVKINFGRRPVEHYLRSFDLHVERVDMRPLDAADGFCGLSHRSLGSFGKTVFGRSNHFDHFLRHHKLLKMFDGIVRQFEMRGQACTGDLRPSRMRTTWSRTRWATSHLVVSGTSMTSS